MATSAGLSATLTASGTLTATMAKATAGTDLIDSDGNYIVTDNNDLIGVSEAGVLKLSATLTPVTTTIGG